LRQVFLHEPKLANELHRIGAQLCAAHTSLGFAFLPMGLSGKEVNPPDLEIAKNPLRVPSLESSFLIPRMGDVLAPSYLL
jgi:hypothetical protein